ncbi:hypothetical protein DSL72_003302 [Monilinia vaccinii-corymbosi]|uniref:Uncharacterized protein n=1 Tax=Monilinia vaccinii-corymbosi TaxID=61207 RepID=A0A8A3P8W0_9HELO|nr:hypothetical protein DSL72_003302 [Monilinia vaccinii-corymbosi]
MNSVNSNAKISLTTTRGYRQLLPKLPSPMVRAINLHAEMRVQQVMSVVGYTIYEKAARTGKVLHYHWEDNYIKEEASSEVDKAYAYPKSFVPETIALSKYPNLLCIIVV